MASYAPNTQVSSDKSKAEIERTLQRYGATGFMYGWQDSKAMIAFQMANRHIKFILPMPDRNSKEFTHTDKGRIRADNAQQQAYEQSIRQKWRALALVIKAKLEAVESEISEFEEEFLANIILPDGKTVGNFMVPQVRKAYESGKMPALLTM
jgi:hypothetical protein